MAHRTDQKSSNQAGNGSSHKAGHSGSVKGQKGVSQEQVGSGKEHDPNNSANDPARASAAGHNGGQHSHDPD